MIQDIDLEEVHIFFSIPYWLGWSVLESGWPSESDIKDPGTEYDDLDNVNTDGFAKLATMCKLGTLFAHPDTTNMHEHIRMRRDIPGAMRNRGKLFLRTSACSS